MESFLETLKDNWILFIPVIVLGILLNLWYAKGKDPKGRGTIIAQFDAPDNLTPAEVGTVIDEKVQNKDISSEIINLAVRGYLKITRIESKKLIFKSTDYQLDKLKIEDGLDNDFDKKLVKGLFGSKDSVKLSDLKNKFYDDLAKIKKQLYKVVVKKGYFPRNPNKVRGVYAGVGIVLVFITFFVGPIFGGFGIFSLLSSAVLIIIFSFIMPVRTLKGVHAREHILGLKRYLSVAEKDRIEFHNAPKKDPKQFEKLLPYAMVLGVEKKWAEQFKDIYSQQPGWYNDPTGAGFNSVVLANSLSSFSASANTTMVSRPSSASGGGSGFSGGGGGGGFGGGGGGSW